MKKFSKILILFIFMFFFLISNLTAGITRTNNNDIEKDEQRIKNTVIESVIHNPEYISFLEEELLDSCETASEYASCSFVIGKLKSLLQDAEGLSVVDNPSKDDNFSYDEIKNILYEFSNTLANDDLLIRDSLPDLMNGMSLKFNQQIESSNSDKLRKAEEKIESEAIELGPIIYRSKVPTDNYYTGDTSIDRLLVSIGMGGCYSTFVKEILASVSIQFTDLLYKNLVVDTQFSLDVNTIEYDSLLLTELYTGIGSIFNSLNPLYIICSGGVTVSKNYMNQYWVITPTVRFEVGTILDKFAEELSVTIGLGVLLTGQNISVLWTIGAGY